MKYNKLENLKNKDLTYFGERAEPYFCSQAIISGMQDEKKSLKLTNLKTTVRWFQIYYYFYQFTSDLIKIEKEIKAELEKKGNQYVDRLIEKNLEAGKKLCITSTRLGKTASLPINRKKMAKAVLDYLQAVQNYSIFYQITFFDNPLMKIAEEVIKRNAKLNYDAIELSNLIFATDRLTAAEYEQDDFLRLASASVGDKKTLAEKHAKKYGWLAVRYFLGDTWTKEDLLKRLRGVKQGQAENELKNRLAHREERERMIIKAIKNFSVSDKKIVKQVRKSIYLRTQRGDFLHESASRVRPLLNKIAHELDVSYFELINLSAQEIEQSLNSGFDYKIHIKNRLKNFLIYHDWSDGGIVLEGNDVEKYLASHKFLRLDTENVSEFSGKTGYRGKLRGVVKVVKVNADMKKVKRGDIIVTTMTTSNLLPALEKASAFITDEGGITSHAAIIAREMKKPCIIGTKIATKVLHDGDLVEVDANKGVVKIIK